MVEDAERNLQLRRLLRWVTNEFAPAKEIAKKHFAFNPLSLETWVRASDALKKTWIKEKKSPTFDELISQLEDLGYVESFTGRRDPKNPSRKLSRETTFYKLTDKGIQVKPRFR